MNPAQSGPRRVLLRRSSARPGRVGLTVGLVEATTDGAGAPHRRTAAHARVDARSRCRCLISRAGETRRDGQPAGPIARRIGPVAAHRAVQLDPSAGVSIEDGADGLECGRRLGADTANGG